MVEYTEIHQQNPLFKQSKDNHYKVISLVAEKGVDQIQDLFMRKVLETTGIQGPYLNIVIVIHNNSSQHQTKWRQTGSNPT